jgi:hypothetical protein
VTIDRREVFEPPAPDASPAANDPGRTAEGGTAARQHSSTRDEGSGAGALDARHVNADERQRGEVDLGNAVNIALGAGVAVADLATTAARPFVSAAVGALRLAARVSGRRPHTGIAERLADRGGRFREALERALAEVVRFVLPQVVERALTTLDVTGLVRAHVDLDALAKIIDVDAVVSRVDLDAAVARVDLDAAVSRVDIDAVISRVDLDGIAARLDVDAVIDRADLDRAVSRVDLGSIVQRVDPDEIVARVNIEAALDRLDLAGIARQVIEAIDLAEILRESAGVVSSQAARVVRTEGMNADDSVARFFDRVLRRPHPGGAVTP